jgi:lysophospholipase L1-like esterase
MDWPAQLARRIAGAAATGGWVVVNAGISGNRLLHEGSGPSAVERFDRDVLGIPGVKAVILTEGINDIGWAFDPAGDTGPLTLADIIGAYREMIARAHAHGLRIFAGTLNPYEGAGYHHPEGEKLREAVNEWLRSSGAFDGVFDFDRAVRDPGHPGQYRGAYQSGDSLHPNDAGYQAMSEAVDLDRLGPGR